MRVEELNEWIEREGRWEFSRSGGPGGQNVNKVSTRTTLRLPIERLPLPEHQRQTVRERLANRVTNDGELVIHASQTRSQHANRRLAHNRAVTLLLSALTPGRRRIATRPTRTAAERRIQQKKRRAQRKQDRRPPEP